MDPAPSPLDGRLIAAMTRIAPTTTEPVITPIQATTATGLLADKADVAGFPLNARPGAVGKASLLVRGGLQRLMFQVLHRQTEYNRLAAQAIDALTRGQAEEASDRARRRALQEASERRLRALDARVARLAEHNADLEQRLALRERALEQFEARLYADAQETGPANFDYLGMQEQFRGSGVRITERQRGYVRHLAGQRDVLDAGCGRGEFLDLLSIEGIPAFGIDLEPDMVEQCRLRGLEVTQADAIAWLERREPESLGGVFAAQVIEHLAPARIVSLVQLAYSRLRPGGVLILETVNPTSLVTFASFYIDFTHVKPVHPLALQSLARSVGFDPTEIEYHTPIDPSRRLQHLPAITGAEVNDDAREAFDRGLDVANDLIFGFQEFALIARKPAA